jgi:hypothetical protein
MNCKNDLAFKLIFIVDNYLKNKNIDRFYKKINNYNYKISFYINNDLYDYYKNYNKIIYDNMINGEHDETLINDFINIIRKILIVLLVFE